MAVSFSSAMHSLIAVGSDGSPLTPCITWADQRAAGHARAMRSDGSLTELRRRIGVPVHAMLPLCKLMWLKENEPDIHRSAAAFIGIREFVMHRWSGRPYRTDPSMAGRDGHV